MSVAPTLSNMDSIEVLGSTNIAEAKRIKRRGDHERIIGETDSGMLKRLN